MRSDPLRQVLRIAQEAIEIDDDEVAGEIDQLAERTGEKPGEGPGVSNGNASSGRYARIRPRKALAFLIEHTTVVDESGNPIDSPHPRPPKHRKTPMERHPQRSPCRERAHTQRLLHPLRHGADRGPETPPSSTAR